MSLSLSPSFSFSNNCWKETFINSKSLCPCSAYYELRKGREVGRKKRKKEVKKKKNLLTFIQEQLQKKKKKNHRLPSSCNLSDKLLDLVLN